jgi:hypothetical protein
MDTSSGGMGTCDGIKDDQTVHILDDRITADKINDHHSLPISDGVAAGAPESTDSPRIRRMGWQEKQVRRNSMLARAHTMPVSRRRDSVTAEDEDICALRTRVLSKMAQERGSTTSSPSPGSPAPVKFSRSRRSSADQSVNQMPPSDMDGFFDLSLTPSVHINQIPVIENRPIITTIHPVSAVEHDFARQEKGHDKGPPLASRRRRFSCSMPARAMKTVRALKFSGADHTRSHHWASTLQMLSDSVTEEGDSPEELSAQVQRILDSVEDNDPSVPRLSKYLQVCRSA